MAEQKKNSAEQNAANRAIAYPFGSAVVKKSEYEMSARDNRGGERSCAVLMVDIPIISCGLIVTSTMYANFDPKRGEITFQASLPKNVKMPEENDKALFRAHALSAAEAFREWDALQARAESVLLGRNVKPTFDRATKLVRTVSGQRQTVAEIQTPATA